MRALRLLLIFVFGTLALSGCGVRSIPMQKNAVEAALAEVSNQYKRRSDLIPNLVQVVQGYAKHERQTLESVTAARARATSINIDPSKTSPEDLKRWQASQGELSSALGRLLAVSENYPQLKANENFRDLQAQLEGTENRITVARQRYIETLQGFNNLVGVFPTNLANGLFFHYDKLPQWELSPDEKKTAEKAPEVKF